MCWLGWLDCPSSSSDALLCLTSVCIALPPCCCQLWLFGAPFRFEAALAEYQCLLGRSTRHTMLQDLSGLCLCRSLMFPNTPASTHIRWSATMCCARGLLVWAPYHTLYTTCCAALCQTCLPSFGLAPGVSVCPHSPCGHGQAGVPVVLVGHHDSWMATSACGHACKSPLSMLVVSHCW